MREQLKELTKQFDKSENDLKALQSVGQIVGEVLKQLTEDKCMFTSNSLHKLTSASFSNRLFVLFAFYFDCSYCESNEWSSICSWMSSAIG